MEIIKSILEAILEIVSGICTVFIELLMELFKPSRITEYTAEWGEIRYQFHKKGDGFRIGYAWGNSLIESNNHLICLGGSGSKKSSCICYPTLLQSHDTSYVIFDTSRELYTTSGYLNKKGYDIFRMDYDDYKQSIGFNGLGNCSNETDVSRIVQTITKNSLEGSTYDYWAQSGEQLAGFFATALFLHADPLYVNFSNVLNMLQVFSYDPERIGLWIIRTGNKRLLEKFKSISATPEKTLQSSVATAINSLSIYGSPNIAAITSQTTLAFEQFRQKRTALFISGSPSMTQYCRGVSASFFESFFSFILQKLPEPGSLNITFLIDEANTMRLGSLPQILELGRKFRISVATLWQDFNQVEQIFGKHQAANILANSKLKAFMPSGQPLATCRMLEELLGRYSFEDNNGGLRSRELLNAQEIFQLKKILVLNGNEKPLLLEPKPYFLSSKLKKYTEMPPFQLGNTNLLSDPPLLQFD